MFPRGGHRLEIQYRVRKSYHPTLDINLDHTLYNLEKVRVVIFIFGSVQESLIVHIQK